VREEAKVSGHSQMDNEQRLIIGGDEQVLGASLDGANCLAAEHFVHGNLGDWMAQGLAAVPDTGDETIGQVRAQSPADDLDFRELRHG
jgi:hypothetical protein